MRAKIENFRAQTLTDNRLSRKSYQLSLRYTLFVNSISYIGVRSLRKKKSNRRRTSQNKSLRNNFEFLSSEKWLHKRAMVTSQKGVCFTLRVTSIGHLAE